MSHSITESPIGTFMSRFMSRSRTPATTSELLTQFTVASTNTASVQNTISNLTSCEHFTVFRTNDNREILVETDTSMSRSRTPATTSELPTQSTVASTNTTSAQSPISNLTPCEHFAVLRTNDNNREILMETELLISRQLDTELSGECCACKQAPSTHAFYCGHLCVCSVCVLRFREYVHSCPICVEPITGSMKVYNC